MNCCWCEGSINEPVSSSCALRYFGVLFEKLGQWRQSTQIDATKIVNAKTWIGYALP